MNATDACMLRLKSDSLLVSMPAPFHGGSLQQPFKANGVTVMAKSPAQARWQHGARLALDEERDLLLVHVEQCQTRIKQAFDRCHQVLELAITANSKGYHPTSNDSVGEELSAYGGDNNALGFATTTETAGRIPQDSGEIGMPCRLDSDQEAINQWRSNNSVDTFMSSVASALKSPGKKGAERVSIERCAERVSIKSPDNRSSGVIDAKRTDLSAKTDMSGKSSRVVFEVDESDHVGEKDHPDMNVAGSMTTTISMTQSSSRKNSRKSRYSQDPDVNDPETQLKKSKTSDHVDRQFGYQGPNAVQTKRFDLFIAIVILANGLVIGVNVQWQGYLTAIDLGIQEDDGGWKHADLVFDILEHTFTGIFTLELLFRLKVQGWRYYKLPMNAFDAFLVASAILDLYVLEILLNSDGAGGNLTLLRFARMFKFVRVLRAVRIFSFCSALRVLIKSIGTGFFNLVWSMILLGGIMALVGLMMSQLVKPTIMSSSRPYDLRIWLFKHYGTAARSMYTMFQVTLSGCWPQYAERLIEEVSPWFAIIYILYVLVVVFAVIRVISALFLRDTLQNAKKDADMMIAEQMKLKENYIGKLRLAFQSIESTGTGWVTRADFDVVMQNPKVLAYLAVLDLEVNESSQLFRLLDNQGEGRITLEDFLDGVLRLKGQARALDVIAIQQDFKTLWRGIQYMNENFERVYGTLPNACPQKIFKQLSCLSALSGLSAEDIGMKVADRLSITNHDDLIGVRL